jgi:anti-sigma B factor antagonist
MGLEEPRMTRKRRLLCEPQGDVTVVNFVEKKILDELNIKEIGDELSELVDQHNKDKILINFENVEYLSSAALGKLITLSKKMQAKKGQLKLCEIAPSIYEIFKITKLNKFFEIHETEADALAAFTR